MVRNKPTSIIKTKKLSSVQQRAVKRLMRDLKQINEEPLDGIAALPLEDNLFIWHANLRGPAGTPWERGIFHIVMKFPETYPDDPPKLTVSTKITHPNVMPDNSICLDMLQQKRGGDAQKFEGWSASYSVQTILIQLQAFLFESSVATALAKLHDPSLYETEKAKWLSGVNYSVDQSLGYQDASVKHHPPRNPWPPLKPVPQQKPKGLKQLLQEELVCYYTKQTYEEDCLGVGVKFTKNLRTGEIKTIQSPVDLLSLRAYMNNNVRLSAMNEKFTHWLPVYLCEKHGEKARYLAKRALSMICTGSTKNFTPDMVLYVLPKLMSTMVVEVMSGKRHASLKAFRGYCLFHRLFIMFVDEYPELLEKCTEAVRKFIEDESSRHKDITTNLGEFLTLLTVTDFSWRDVRDAYLEESFIRNVFWIIAKYPELEKLDNPLITDEDRLKYSFEVATTSSRLLQFHVFFLEKVARPPNGSRASVAALYDEYVGLPSPQLEEMFLTASERIMKLNNYVDYLKGVGREATEADVLVTLKSAIQKSFNKGYHGTAPTVLSPEEFAKENQLVDLNKLLVTNAEGKQSLHSNDEEWKEMCNKRFGFSKLPDYLSSGDDAMDTDDRAPSTSAAAAAAAATVAVPNPWKKLYLQYHIQNLIQRLNEVPDFPSFYRDLDLSAEDITRLEIQIYDPSNIKSRFFFLTAILTRLKKLDTLVITKGEKGLGVKGFKALVKGLSNNPGCLRNLNLEYCDINAECIEEFTKGKLVSGNLQCLKLVGNPLYDAGAVALAKFLREHQVLPHLTELDLSDCKIGSSGAEALAEALLVKKELKIFYLKRNPMQRGASNIITNLAYSSSITEFDVSRCSAQSISPALSKLLKLSVSLEKLNLWQNNAMGLSDGFFTELRDNRSVKSIDLAECGFNDTLCTKLGEALGKNTVLTHLNMEGNSITSSGLFNMVDELTKPKCRFSVETLNLNRNSSLGMQTLPKHIKSLGYLVRIAQNLTVLKLDLCGLTRDHLEKFGEVIATSKLRELYMRQNKLEKTGIKPLVNGIINSTSLQKLDLSGNKLGVLGAKLMAQILEKNKSLTSVSIYGNFIEIEGAISIAEAMKSNTTLRELDLGLNRIRVRGAKSIVEMLLSANSSSLERLSLKHNHISDKVALEIARAIVTNPARSGTKYIALAGNYITDSIRGEIASMFSRSLPELKFDLAKLVEVKDPEKQERTVYITPLGIGVTEQMIKNLFFKERCGHILSVSIHSHKTRTNVTTANYAFVEFAHPDSVTLAMRLPHSGKNVIGVQKIMITRAGISNKQTATGKAKKGERGAAPARGGRGGGRGGFRGGRGRGRGGVRAAPVAPARGGARRGGSRR